MTCVFFFFKQKTAYEIGTGDWSSDVCSSDLAPGQKECDSALREIQAASTLLDTPNEPVNDNSYFQCLDTVIDKSTLLGQAMTGEL